MILPLSRKRSRDVEDDFDLTVQRLEKRVRPLAGHTYSTSLPTSSSSGHTNIADSSIVNDEPHVVNDSPQSNVSEAGSSKDVEMDSDMDSDDAMFSQSPEPASPWTLRPSSIRSATRPSAISTRVPTPMIPLSNIGNRPWPGPLQTNLSPLGAASSVPARSTAISSHIPTSSLSSVADRLPSPIDEDEPHTPTAAAGSQMSLLTVNDMEIDVSPPVPPPPPPKSTDVFAVRRQRQRSGAFTSTPDAARKFSMGFRIDCEKCRMRVPGHMNHFLDN